LDLLAEIVRIPENERVADLNRPIDFVVGTPDTFFSLADIQEGRHLDRAYLLEQGYDFCQDYDIFLLMADPDFSLDSTRVLVWTQAFEHASLDGSSVFQLTQKEPSGGTISLGFYTISDSKKIDLSIPIILRVSPVKQSPPTPDEGPADVNL
jgi:hypothetical protein